MMVKDGTDARNVENNQHYWAHHSMRYALMAI
jgi:hypothetical protein